MYTHSMPIAFCLHLMAYPAYKYGMGLHSSLYQFMKIIIERVSEILITAASLT
jgi:hypothetical protein